MQAGNSICVEPGRFWKIRIPVPEAQEGENYGRTKGRKMEEKAWNVVIVTRRQRPAPKKKENNYRTV